jgi:mannosylglycerate hydrolase
MTRRVHIVPHTHWDREWYLPFQTFRLRLVDLLDDLLPRMETDPSYARFLLDGQLAVLDDYLAVRPDSAEAIRRLVASGRLSIGPWYTLPDEFLVSGETLVRNLELGLRAGARYGGAMPLGYLPDMFGHVAQMPQILTQFGFDQAVVWRGVPSAVDRSGFWWRAPDGSTVRAEYLPEGYGNGAYLPGDAKSLVRQIAEFDQRYGDMLEASPILWMNGGDHQAPRPWLGRVVAEANDIQDDYELVVTSLPEHLATVPHDGLPIWDGELRSGARANVLMGVTSNRVDVRRAAAGAERALERLAEPLSALLLSAEEWPQALLDEAWLAMIRNAAHDSVCACSVDEVCDAVLHRYAEATRIAEGLTRRALRALGRRIAHDGPVVVNPSARPRSGIVELTLDAAGPPPAGTQLLSSRPAEDVILEGPVSLVVPAAEELNWDRRIQAFTLETADGDGEETTLVAAERRGGALITSQTREVLGRVDHPGAVRLRIIQQPSMTLLAPVPELPGYGWSAWSPDGGAARAAADEVRVDGTSLHSSMVSLHVDPHDGTWSINGHAGLGRLVDGGDCGDTYNWCPPDTDTLVDTPDAVDIEVLEHGPLRACVAIRSTYRWPERCAGQQQRVGEVPHTLVTRLELRAGEGFVRVVTHIDNRSRDHRLRAHFPLPEPADRSYAECAFATVERGLDAEGGRTEAPLATYPARRFVQAGGLTIVAHGVAEYELTGRDGAGGHAGELALTLLRASGMLSQGPMATRPLPAGPLIPLEGSQLQGPVTMRYAVATGRGIDAYALADEVLVPLQVAYPGTRDGAPADPDDPERSRLAPQGSALAIDGAEVSAVRRVGKGLRVRVVNPTDRPATVSLPGRQGWVVDLRDRPLEAFEGRVDLRPWGIATLALT